MSSTNLLIQVSERRALGGSAHGAGPRLTLVLGAIAAIFAWRERSRTRVALDRLSDSQLRDVGLDRTAVGLRPLQPGSAADRQRHLLR